MEKAETVTKDVDLNHEVNNAKCEDTAMRPDELTTLQAKGEFFAAVDLGSNSFHLVVVYVQNGNVQIVSKVKQKVRLANGLNEDMVLSEEAMERGWSCLVSFADRLQNIPAKNIKIVATATLRLAVNAHAFLQRAENILGHTIRVISGQEEAAEIYRGVAYTSTTIGNTLVIDIGGASTEVVLGRDITPIHLHSFNMGCVTFMDQYFGNGLLNKTNFEQAIAAAKTIIEPAANPFLCFDWQMCLGASGTPQAITDILIDQGNRDAIKLSYMRALLVQCIEYEHIDRLAIPGLAESRLAIFPSGLAILIALFEVLGIKEMNIAGGALREGLIYGMLDDQPLDDRRQQTITGCLKRFHIHTEQARSVTQTALNLYSQMCQHAEICSLDARTLLYSASMLHEIGLHIEFKNYHLHGAYILEHTPLEGFTKLQRQCIAELVRYHRQAVPQDVFADYPEETRPTLTALLRVLRLAVIIHTKRNGRDRLAELDNIQLMIDEPQWTLCFPDGWLKHNKLVEIELTNESWLQYKINHKLVIQETTV